MLAANLRDAHATKDYALLVILWLDPEARDETAIRLAAREAAMNAIRSAVTLVSAEQVLEQARTSETARNNFYSGA